MLEQIRKIVNLNAYSESKYFIGFFESAENKPSEKVIIDIKNLFEKFFIYMGSECWIITSLVKSLWPGCKLNGEAKNDIEALLAGNWISKKNIDDYIDKELPFCTFEYVQNSHKNLILPLFRLIMKYGCLSGHVFFLWPKYEIVIYPHDDIGIGIIAGNNIDGRLKAIKFLEEMKDNVKYVVELKI